MASKSYQAEAQQLYLQPTRVELLAAQTETNQKPRWGKLLLLVALATTFGGAVSTGYCIGVINAPSKLMKAWCNQTLHENYGSNLSESGLDLLWSCIVSVFLVGGAIGSLGGAGAANKFGRKACFLICGALFTVGAVLFFFCRAANSVEMLVIGRFIVGLASGLVTATLPMYLSEVAPLALRGTLGVFCAVGVTGGVVVGQVFSLADIFGTEDLWHYALTAYMVLILVCYLPSYVFPESPKFLYIVKGNHAAAKRELQRLRGKDAEDLIAQEIAEMEAEANAKVQTSSFCDVLRDPRLTLPLIIVCCFHGGQQLSGINAIFYYSVSIFEKAGLSTVNAQWANLGAGCLNLSISLLGPWLMAYCNRRTLMMFSCALCSVFLFTIAFVLFYIDYVSWFAIACIFCIMGYIFFYQFGLGPIPYFIGSELFEVAPRSVAMSMGSLASWTCNFIIGISFPLLQNAWGAFVFLPFSITCVLLCLLTKFYLPETRGRDPSEVAPLVSKGFRSKHVTPPRVSGWTPLLLLISLTVTLGTTVPVGYFFGILNAPAEIIKKWCQDILASEYDTIVTASQLDILWTSIVSIYLIGGICGSCFSALCSDKYGRKGCLMISCILLVISGILFTWCRAAKSLEMLMVGRFLGGIASALIFTAQPMYLLEAAPSELSGSVGVFTCIGVTGGILLAQVLTLSQLLGNERFWPYALSFYSLLVMASLLLLWWFPESPRWLYLHKRDAAASERALVRLRGRYAEEEVQREMLEMKATLEAKASSKASSLCSVLRDRELWLPLLLVCSFQATQQLSGINAIFFYSLAILTDAGFSSGAATWLNLGIGGFNMCTSLLGPLLISRFPRRPLMMLSCSICAFALFAMSFGLFYLEASESTVLAYFCAAFILTFILGFQLGLGPIAYFIGSELLEDSPRPVAMSMGSLFSWIGNFLVGMCFPLLQSVWSSFAFVPCMCVCLYCLLLTWRYLPETRGREPKDVKPLMSQGLASKRR